MLNLFPQLGIRLTCFKWILAVLASSIFLFNLCLGAVANMTHIRVIQFYPTVAITTLFLNILMDPLENQARLDLELLCSAAKIPRLMPVYQNTSRRYLHVQMFEGFVFELVRQGHCAIRAKKARSAIVVATKETT